MEGGRGGPLGRNLAWPAQVSAEEESPLNKGGHPPPGGAREGLMETPPHGTWLLRCPPLGSLGSCATWAIWQSPPRRGHTPHTLQAHAPARTPMPQTPSALAHPQPALQVHTLTFASPTLGICLENQWDPKDGHVVHEHAQGADLSLLDL